MRLVESPSGASWTLIVNGRCRLVGIPPEALEYEVSGRSPLRWAVDSLRFKEDGASGIRDDPNGWHTWAAEPFELIRHLRRLAYVGIRSAEIIRGLPPSLRPGHAADAPATSAGVNSPDAPSARQRSGGPGESGGPADELPRAVAIDPAGEADTEG